MCNHTELLNKSRWLGISLSTAAIACALMAPQRAHAQDPRAQDSRAQDRGQDRVSCSSDGARVVCDADTSGGVRMVRQFGGSRPCNQGSSWGYNERGVWVDRGCKAEFALQGAQASSRTYGQKYTRIERGTEIPVRTNQDIDSTRLDYRIYTGQVDQDVRGSDGNLAIPRGAPVEMMVRRQPDGDLVLDMESVSINGQRYALNTQSKEYESRQGVGANRRTGEYVGGGAILGGIIGAIAGGGKGAAVGAAAGAAAGAGTQVLTRGREVRVPAESVVTFRVDQPLDVGVADRGVDRDGYHYHDYYGRPSGD